MAIQTEPRQRVQIERKLFTKQEYYAMANAAILTENDRVELLEGEIVVMAPIGNRHAACVDRLNHAFATSGILQDPVLLRIQNPLSASDSSELEPDLMILARREDFFDLAHPVPRDVRLLVEVADSSIGYDRYTKVPFYAEIGIPETWLVDLEADQIDVYTEPSSEGYRVTRRYVIGDSIAPSAFPDVEVEVSRIIPARPSEE